LRFLPGFVLHALKSRSQVQRAAGFQGGSLLADRRSTFWTMTAWDGEEAMRAYILAGDHRAAMPRLLAWCDEASVVHWVHDEQTLPSWRSAAERMRQEGRPSKVGNPSPNHAGLSFDVPRLTVAAPIPNRRPR
jgi:hypothetical protein